MTLLQQNRIVEKQTNFEVRPMIMSQPIFARQDACVIAVS